MTESFDRSDDFREEGRQFQNEVERDCNEKIGKIVNMLRDARHEMKLSQQDIADATGMKAPNINRLERHKTKPSLEILMRYAEAMGYDVDITLRKK